MTNRFLSVDVVIGGPGQTFLVQPRSVIPGRQRWDIGVLLGRPHVAQLLEERLRDSKGLTEVRANAVTGRLLVWHEHALTSEEIGGLVRRAVAWLDGPVGIFGMPQADGPTRYRAAIAGPDRALGTPLVVAGSACAVLVARVVIASPMARLALVAVATVVVVRRGWRAADSREEVSSESRLEHPLLHIAGSHRRTLYMASALSVLGQALDMVPTVLIAVMAVVLLTGESSVLLALGLTTATSQLISLAVATGLVSVVNSGVSFAGATLWRQLGQLVVHEWRRDTYAHVQRVELRYLEDERTTRLARVLTGDLDQLGSFFANSADYLVRLGTSFLVLIPAFLIIGPGVAWIAFLPVPIIAWMSFYYHEHAAPEYAASNLNGSLLNGQLVNNLQAAATIKSFGAEDYEIARITRLSDAYRESNSRVESRTTSYTQIVRGTAFASLAGTLVLGGLEVLSGALTFEAFTSLAGLPQIVHFQLPQLGDAVDEYQRTTAALTRVLELRKLPIESLDAGLRVDMGSLDGELILEQVSFGYPGRSPLFRDLSLRIAPRKMTGIVGVTGAGKTTIAKLMLRFHEVDSGRVLLDGADVRDLSLPDVRRAISFVAQEPFLFDGTAADNIRYGSFDADLSQVAMAAQLAEADSFIEALPLGYDTMVGERGITLSGGQKQRISLARAVLKGAPILILDEATSAVDNATESAIQQALRDFARNRTLVIIAHRLSTIRDADCIYVISEGGAIAEEGTHQDLLLRDGVYASLWRRQIGEPGR